MSESCRLAIRSVRTGVTRTAEGRGGLGERKAYPSPDGQRVLWIENLGEFVMGASHYALKLGAAGETFERARRLSIPGREKARIACPDYYYQPWTCDSRSILVCPYENQPLLLDLESARTRELGVSHKRFITCLCGPTQDVVFIVPRAEKEHAYFASLKEGSPAVRVDGSVSYSAAFWLGDKDETLLLLQQEPSTGRSSLKMLSPANSRPLAQLVVSPSRLLPFDDPRTAGLKIGAYRNVDLGSWNRLGTGFPYLDVWTRIRYDATKAALSLEIARPKGKPERLSWIWRTFTVPITFVSVECELSF